VPQVDYIGPPAPVQEATSLIVIQIAAVTSNDPRVLTAQLPIEDVGLRVPVAGHGEPENVAIAPDPRQGRKSGASLAHILHT
jgi:hypothetical protein